MELGRAQWLIGSVWLGAMDELALGSTGDADSAEEVFLVAVELLQDILWTM